MPFNEQRTFITRLNRSINIHLNSSYWFARMLSKIANGKENYFKIDKQKNYVKMRLSLEHFSFNHDIGIKKWWKKSESKLGSFTIKING